jgi:hypothetical protein
VSWVTSIARLTAGEVVAIDGKALRGTRKAGHKGIVHLVSAWANTNNVVLAPSAEICGDGFAQSPEGATSSPAQVPLQELFRILLPALPAGGTGVILHFDASGRRARHGIAPVRPSGRVED